MRLSLRVSGQGWRGHGLRPADCESSLGEQGETQYARGLHAWRWARTGFWVGVIGIGCRGSCRTENASLMMWAATLPVLRADDMYTEASK